MSAFPFTRLYAQNIVTALHLEKKEPRPLWFEYSKIDNGLVTLSHSTKNSSRKISIFKYDDDFKREWVKPLFEQNGYKNIENLVVLGERIFVFMNEQVPREKNHIYYRYEYDLEGNRLNRDTLIYKMDKAPDRKRYFRYVRSINKKKMLCFRSGESNAQVQNLVRYCIFDANEGDYQQGTFALPYPDDSLLLKEVKVSNSGNIYVLARHYKGGRIRSPNDYRFIVFKYEVSTQSLQQYVIAVHDKFITDLTIKPDKEENLLIAGFYSNKSETQIIGTCFTRIPVGSTDMLPLIFDKFDEKLLVNYLTPRQIERGRELADFFLDDMVLRTDGGILLLAEQYYETSTWYRDIYGFMETRSLFHYDDVLVLSISAEGKIEWNTAVTKNQSAETQLELSYLSLVGAEQLLIFYKTRLKGTGTNVYYSKIDYEGKIENPRPFFEDFNISDVFYREACEQISNREALLVYYQSKKRLFTFAKISF